MTATATGEEIKLATLLARAGVASRRRAAELVRSGEVTVAGRVETDPSRRVDPRRTQVRAGGQRVRPERLVYLLLHKPRGFICTESGREGPRTSALLRGVRERVVVAGRLDKESEGLVLFTNDGELINRVTHPRYGMPKTYRVQVDGWFAPAAAEQLRQGVRLAEGIVRDVQLRVRRRTRQRSVLDLTISSGWNRVIRRIMTKVGHPVRRLQRVAIGPLRLGKVPPGAWRPLTGTEARQLKQESALPAAADRGRANRKNRRPK